LQAHQIPVAVLVVNHNAMLLEGIAVLIRSQPDMTLIASAKCADSAIMAYLEARPDITVIDLELPDSSAIRAIRRIRTADANAKLIGVTTYELDNSAREALTAGALAIIAKDRIGETLVDLIRNVARPQ
jgi:DNA-binding NarL/FixJ family response regulator